MKLNKTTNQRYNKIFLFSLFVLILFVIYCSFKFIGTQKDALSVIIASITVYIAYQQYKISSFRSNNEFLKEKLQIIDELAMLFDKIKNIKIDEDEEEKYEIDEVINEIYKLDLKTIILFKNKSFSNQLVALVKKFKKDCEKYDEYVHPYKTYKSGIIRNIDLSHVDIKKEMVNVGNLIIDDLIKINKFYEKLQQDLLIAMRQTENPNILEYIYKQKK